MEKTLPMCEEDWPTPSSDFSYAIYSGEKEVFALYYVCMNRRLWLSGRKGRLSQCLNGTWTSILDECAEGKRKRNARKITMMVKHIGLSL